MGKSSLSFERIEEILGVHLDIILDLQTLDIRETRAPATGDSPRATHFRSPTITPDPRPRHKGYLNKS